MKKLTAVLLSILLGFNSFVPILAEENDSQKFEDWMDSEFRTAMSNDYMTMHYTDTDWQSLGIEKPELSIGTIDNSDDLQDVQDGLDFLESLNTSSFSDLQKHEYESIKFEYENTIAIYQAKNYYMVFLPASSVIDNLTTNFTEFVFYQASDIDDYLEILKTVPDYLDQALDLTKEQAENGYFMTDDALDQTLDQINKFVEKTDDNELIVVFDEQVDAFAGITDEQKEAYKSENKGIILNSYIPAYQKCGEELEKLRGSRKGNTYYDMEGGLDYYKALVRNNASTDESIQELFDECNEYLKNTVNAYYKLMQKSDGTGSDKGLDEMTADEIIAYHLDHLQNYPEIGTFPYKIQTLDPSVANDSTIAYYVSPPIDHIENNVIKVNGDSVSDTTELYMYLAHEGVPGHMYQTNYNFQIDGLNKEMNLLSILGYSEGWAMYSMMEAFDYSDLSDDEKEEQKIDLGLGYVLDAAADLAVNGLGYDQSDLAKWLNGLGLNSAIAYSLYDFVNKEPGVLLAYGIGTVKYMNMKSQAQKALGNAFDLKEFNTVLLQYGPRNLDIVQSDVNAYLNTDDIEDVQKAETNGVHYLYYGLGAGVAVTILIIVLANRKYRQEDQY